MRRFSFSLEPILRMRAHEERRVEHRLADITGKCVLLRREIADLTARKIGSYENVAAEFRADIAFRQDHDAFVQGIQLRVDRLERELARRETERAAVQEEYRAVRARRKAIEELRNRRETDHYRAERAAENRTIDEIGGSVYLQNRQADG